jgi:hypothetical protein
MSYLPEGLNAGMITALVVIFVLLSSLLRRSSLVPLIKVLEKRAARVAAAQAHKAAAGPGGRPRRSYASAHDPSRSRLAGAIRRSLPAAVHGSSHRSDQPGRRRIRGQARAGARMQ